MNIYIYVYITKYIFFILDTRKTKSVRNEKGGMLLNQSIRSLNARGLDA